MSCINKPGASQEVWTMVVVAVVWLEHSMQYGLSQLMLRGVWNLSAFVRGLTATSHLALA